MAEDPGSDYSPGPDEEYMNERQLAYFRAKLLAWRVELLEEAQGTLDGLGSRISGSRKTRDGKTTATLGSVVRELDLRYDD